MLDTAQLKSSILRYLGVRPRSKFEIEKYLLKKQASSSQINEILEYLTSHHLIDDQEFAKWFTESKFRRKPVGKTLLKLQLAKYGVAIDVEDIEVNEREGAKKVAEKLSKKWIHLDPQKQKQKQIAYLRNHGFSQRIIELVLNPRYNE